MRIARICIALGVCVCVIAVIIGAMLGCAYSCYAGLRPSQEKFGAMGDINEPVEAEWEYWESLSPNVVARLRVSGADIDLPVMRASVDEPDWYLTHDVFESWSLFGSVFADARCSWGDGSGYYILGHNISVPPAMFHGLVNANDAELSDSAEIYRWENEHEVRYELRYLGKEVITKADEMGKYIGADEDVIKDAFGDDVEQLVALATCSYNIMPANERTVVYYDARRVD